MEVVAERESRMERHLGAEARSTSKSLTGGSSSKSCSKWCFNVVPSFFGLRLYFRVFRSSC